MWPDGVSPLQPKHVAVNKLKKLTLRVILYVHL